MCTLSVEKLAKCLFRSTEPFPSRQEDQVMYSAEWVAKSLCTKVATLLKCTVAHTIFQSLDSDHCTEGANSNVGSCSNDTDVGVKGCQ